MNSRRDRSSLASPVSTAPATDSLFAEDTVANNGPESEPPRTRSADVAPADADEALHRLGRRLPDSVFLGTSSWSFPGWRGIVYRDQHTEAQLARNGLTAYAQHPILRTVGIDRGFYQPLAVDDLAHYVRQVPAGFRFLVKAPALVTEAVRRSDGAGGSRGATGTNPDFLDTALATERFVLPTLAGLGVHGGPLVFQLSPLPRAMLAGAAAHAMIERIGAFIAGLPRAVAGIEPVYAIEPRNAELLTPRFVRTLRATGARLCLALHARMPAAARQSAALRALDADADEGDHWRMKGPLVVRWSLHEGLRYDQAKQRYAPFSRIVDADIPARGTLAHLIDVAVRSGQCAFVIVNNKAEGCAPLSCIELARALVGGH